MKILLTGASGFLGRALALRLAAEGYGLRLPLRRHLPQNWLPDGAQAPVVPAIETLTAQEWRSLCTGMDAVIHAAAIAHIGPSVSPELYKAVNCDASARLAEAAAQEGVKRFIFISSIRAQVGAASRDVQNETNLPAPTEPYGRSKLEAERLIRQSFPEAVIFRPAVIIGPEPKGNLRTLLKLADLPLPLPLGGLRGPQAMVALEPFIQAIIMALAAPAMTGETYVASQEPHLTLAEIMRAFRKGLERPPMQFCVPESWLTGPLRLIRKGDLAERLSDGLKVDASKLRAAGWRPEPSLTEAIQAVAKAFRVKEA